MEFTNKNRKNVVILIRIDYNNNIKIIKTSFSFLFNRRNIMKLLRIHVDGLSLMKDSLDITFYGLQRIGEDDTKIMHHLFNNIYLNCANAFIGKNASGKTTILQTISLALKLLNNEPINHISSKYVLSSSTNVMISIFYYIKGDGIYCLKTKISSKTDLGNQPYYTISDEKLYYQALSSVKSKKMLTDINQFQLIKERNLNEEYLPEDVSMIISQNKKLNIHLSVLNLMSFTNIDKLSLDDSTSLEIIQFLDPTIEALYTENINNNSLIHLKFKNKKEIMLHSLSELEFYLSSGTIKGITAFTLAKESLKLGGYLLIDEIENHFNKEIAFTLIRMFMDSDFNINGGVLIYTTHYPELLDEYERNDSIYITENTNGIMATNLSYLLKRNDIKKSEAYQADMIAETSPKYEDYICMKKSILSYIKKGS